MVERGVEAVSYQGFRFPAEVISHAVWLYFRFPLSFREAEELLLARGIIVSHETVRAWCGRYGPQYAAQLRRRRPQAGDKWYLDEVFIKVNGAWHYLWRAVDQDGNVLDILVQSRRNAKAAKAVPGQALSSCSWGRSTAGLQQGSPGSRDLSS